LSSFDTLLAEHVDQFAGSLLLIYKNDYHSHEEVLMYLHYEVKLLNFLVKSNSRLLNTLKLEVLCFYSEGNDFTDVVLSSLKHFIRVGRGVSAVLRSLLIFLKLLLQ
jgi:hypothetical protein